LEFYQLILVISKIGILQINSVKPQMFIVGSSESYKREMINLKIDYILWSNTNKYKEKQNLKIICVKMKLVYNEKCSNVILLIST